MASEQTQWTLWRLYAENKVQYFDPFHSKCSQKDIENDKKIKIKEKPRSRKWDARFVCILLTSASPNRIARRPCHIYRKKKKRYKKRWETLMLFDIMQKFDPWSKLGPNDAYNEYDLVRQKCNVRVLVRFRSFTFLHRLPCSQFLTKKKKFSSIWIDNQFFPYSIVYLLVLAYSALCQCKVNSATSYGGQKEAVYGLCKYK